MKCRATVRLLTFRDIINHQHWQCLIGKDGHSPVARDLKGQLSQDKAAKVGLNDGYGFGILALSKGRVWTLGSRRKPDDFGAQIGF